MPAFSIPSLPETLNQELDITQQKVAGLLLNTRYQEVLRFFAKQASTITALAQHLEVSVSNAYYYVKVLKQTGILKESSSQRRSGKALKHYACSADSYFIPNHIAPIASMRELFAAAEAPWRELLEQSIEQHVYDREGWGLRIFRDDVGTMHTSFTPQKNWRDWGWLEYDFLPEQAAIFSAIVPLYLKRDQAKVLQAELGKLFQSYYIDPLTSKSETTPEPSYIMRLELTPLPNTKLKSK